MTDQDQKAQSRAIRKLAANSTMISILYADGMTHSRIEILTTALTSGDINAFYDAVIYDLEEFVADNGGIEEWPS